MHFDAVIFGGGAAGLWLLDELVRRNISAVLLEAERLGSGQTIAAQGIIHGGLKYTLQGLLTGSARTIREMPLIWRDCLVGTRTPDLSGTRIRSQYCHLWRTDTVSSRLGMIGAKFGLRVTPRKLERHQCPEVLKNCSGTVAQLDEQVISPRDFVSCLASQHTSRILKINAKSGLSLEGTRSGHVDTIVLRNEHTADTLRLRPKHVVFTAGAGNDRLRQMCGLSDLVMQRRPLHMVMLRGPLPQLNGHCVDGARTRATITSDCDAAGRTVWQIGGRIAEDGVSLEEPLLIEHAEQEIQACIPGIDLTSVECATYRVDRAEGRTESGQRPEAVQILKDANTITAWPTKLALVPDLVRRIAPLIGCAGHPSHVGLPVDWPKPDIALPPWETARNWHLATDRIQRAA